MISWPAAKQIKWVNPSMATVSPSRTSSATASRMVLTLDSATLRARDARHLGAGLLEEAQAHVGLLRGEHERRADPHRAVARPQHEEPAAEARGLHRLGRVVVRELDPD